jgi:hypothetical protein
MTNTTLYQPQTSAEPDPLLLSPNEYHLQSDGIGDLDDLDDEEVDEEDDDDEDVDKEDDTAGDEGIDDGLNSVF